MFGIFFTQLNVKFVGIKNALQNCLWWKNVLKFSTFYWLNLTDWVSVYYENNSMNELSYMKF